MKKTEISSTDTYMLGDNPIDELDDRLKKYVRYYVNIRPYDGPYGGIKLPRKLKKKVKRAIKHEGACRAIRMELGAIVQEYIGRESLMHRLFKVRPLY